MKVVEFLLEVPGMKFTSTSDVDSKDYDGFFQLMSSDLQLSATKSYRHIRRVVSID